ncbi:glycoside hydrolase family 32 protein [Rothia terrae]|uniref:glycoside hydrolase family 32 protein n=1 Tax=Rothia terrae TaxID=396015 RepID=UPI0033DC017E
MSDAAAVHAELVERAEQAAMKLEKERNNRWYPSFHVAARSGWINDPNGLSFFNGRYQVFYQHHAYSAYWGPMHWGHVSSEDMVTFRREHVALAPSIEADRDGVFSGSAVVGDDGKLYAYYTGHRWNNMFNDDDGALQVQCLATSEDGVVFTKHGVVVEGPGLKHFRDPKVFRIDGIWYMIFGACSEDNRGQVWMYTSTDMFNWEFDRILFEDPNPDAFMLECPDIFPLGDKWVLIYCPMGPRKDAYQARNSHNAGYVVGDWAPGEDFKQLTDYRLIDWGHNFYAPQTFEAPDGRRICYGWMGSFTIGTPSQETDGWGGQLTVPRELSLDEDLNLINYPVAEIEKLRGEKTEFGSFVLGLNQDKVLLEQTPPCEILLDVDLSVTDSERVGLKIGLTEDGSHTYVGYDSLAERIFVDRRLVGNGDRGYRAAPFPGGDKLSLRILIDRGSVEVFVNGGVQSVTSFAFPNAGDRAVVLSSESGSITVDRLDIYPLDTIWEDERQ